MFTPGPWRVETETSRKREWIMVVGATGVVARTGATDMPGAVDDARLIAQAPTLAAALAALLEVCDYPQWSSGECRVCGGAAYGESHWPDCAYARAEASARAAVQAARGEGDGDV